MVPAVDPLVLKRIKAKLKQKKYNEQVKSIVIQLTRDDLQNRSKVKATLLRISRMVNEPVPPQSLERWSAWIVSQRIDPANRLHLLRLWAMFR